MKLDENHPSLNICHDGDYDDDDDDDGAIICIISDIWYSSF